jgi:DMSO/TMAO reductase YedYZ molybdopterin-dependent catalytic subunit
MSNLMSANVRLIPLSQTAGQRAIAELEGTALFTSASARNETILTRAQAPPAERIMGVDPLPRTNDAMKATRGFSGRPRGSNTDRVPPGQYVTQEFPVLSAGPTPRTSLESWSLALQHGGELLARWSWTELQSLPQIERATDIHCVTKWTKLGTRWRGVRFDDLMAAAGLASPPSGYVMARCDGGYTTNVPVADLLEGKAMIATQFDGLPLPAVHGGPARLLVPHLYFWKSAKWVRRLEFTEANTPGFWESLGYHIYGDPWREQRYSGD